MCCIALLWCLYRLQGMWLVRLLHVLLTHVCFGVVLKVGVRIDFNIIGSAVTYTRNLRAAFTLNYSRRPMLPIDVRVET